MTIRMGSDCCQCIIEFDMPNETFVDFIQRCEIHKGFASQALVTAVLAHNRSFPVRKVGTRPTSAELDVNEEEKRTERVRIMAIGNPVKKRR